MNEFFWTLKDRDSGSILILAAGDPLPRTSVEGNSDYRGQALDRANR
jgi:hypothetical protein